MGGRGIGEAGAVGQTPRVPAVILASQENQDTEDLERDQLVIPDGQEEEEQDVDEEGRLAAPWASADSATLLPILGNPMKGPVCHLVVVVC